MSNFTKTLAFGAAAAISLPLTVLALAPWIGSQHAFAFHAVAATGGYLAILSVGGRRQLRLGSAAAVLGLVGLGALVWGLSDSPANLVLLLGLEVALVRSGLLFRRRLARTWVIETFVGLGAAATAAFLFTPGLLGSALAIWGWFVVQSFYFPLGGLSRRTKPARGDPFDEASRSLEEILETPA